MKLRNHYKLTPYLLSLILSPAFLIGCDISEDTTDTSTTEESLTVDSSTFSAITMQPGSDQTEMNFSWYTTESEITEIQIALASDMSDDIFPESLATIYTGTATTSVAGEEEERTGPPSDDTTTGDGATDTETVTTDIADAETTETDTSDSGTADTDTTDEETTYLSNQVVVTDLLPNTEYVYRMSNGENYSDVYTFTTQDDNEYSFIVIGDPQIGSSGSVTSDQEGFEETMTKALTTFPDVSFIQGVGDQVNTSSDEDEYSAFLAAEELTSYPFSPAVGNHDNNTLYQYHFNIPNESNDYGTTDASGDYYYTHGNTLFMVLNSNNSSGTSHESFIEETITNNDEDITWKVVIIHHSIYSSANHSDDTSILELRDALYSVIDANDIDVVLMGHDHAYSRTYQMYDNSPITYTANDQGYIENPLGTVYITANSASGSKYYDLEENDTAYRAVRWQGEETSYSHVEITDTTFSITTYSTSDNEVIDSYSILKTN